MHVLCFRNKLDEKVCCGFIFANLFNSPYLLVKLWWNILVSNLATNFQDLVARVKNVITLVPVLGTILCPDHCSINWMGNCYGWETWCHVDCHTGFISWFSRQSFITWKSSMRWITSFSVWKKFQFYWLLMFYHSVYVCCSLYLFCVILKAVSTVLSIASSWLFCLLLFKHVIHTYSTAKAQDSLCNLCGDLVNPWISRNISA